MKRIILLFSALMLSCIALWAHDVEIDGIYYNLDETNKTAEVTYGGDDYYSVSDEYSGSVTIPETITYNSEIYSVTSIGDYAFYGCSGLTSVTIPNSVTSIGSAAFYGCSGLTSITIGNSVTSIGYRAFYNCSGLTKVNYLGTVDKWVDIDFEDFNSNPTYYAKDLYINNELLTDVKITSADSIKYIAFYNCRSIKSVEIGKSVTSIGQYAFYNCSGLTSVTIGNSVTSIGRYAFEDCSGLTKVNYLGTVDKWVDIDFDSNPTWYAEDLYINNELLTDVKITTADSIKNYAFYNCRSIKSVEIGNSVTSIGYRAFYNCSGLTSVTIGESVTSISSSVFSGCSGLTKVNYLGTVDKWVDIDFEDYYSNPTYYAKDLYINNELLTDVKITTVDSIKNYAFYNCQSIKSVEIGKSVTSIGSTAFYDCSGLTSVIWNAKNYKDFSPFYDIRSSITSFTFGNEIEHIPAYLCYGMSKLTGITIPNSVTSIGEDAFDGCDKLRKVTAHPTTVPNAYENSFAHYNAYLYVPCDVYEDYDLDDVFGNFKYIKCIAAEEDEPTSITETLADANITVSGGTISAEADFSIFNTIGQDVTSFNGSLQPGVYLVSIENNIVKVMVH